MLVREGDHLIIDGDVLPINKATSLVAQLNAEEASDTIEGWRYEVSIVSDTLAKVKCFDQYGMVVGYL